MGVAEITVGLPVTDRALSACLGAGGQPVNELPGTAVVQRPGHAVTPIAGALLVAGQAGFPVPFGGRAVSDDSPEPGVTLRSSRAVTGCAGIAFVADGAILSMVVKYAPLRLSSVLDQPVRAVVAGGSLCWVVPMTGRTTGFGNKVPHFLVALHAGLVRQDRRIPGNRIGDRGRMAVLTFEAVGVQ